MSQIQDTWLVGFVKGWCSQWCKIVKSDLGKELLEHQRLPGLEQALMLNKTSLMAIISCPVHTGYNLRSLYRLLFGLNVFSYFYVPEKNENSLYAWDKMPIAQVQPATQLKYNVRKKMTISKTEYNLWGTQTSRRKKNLQIFHRTTLFIGSLLQQHYV